MVLTRAQLKNGGRAGPTPSAGVTANVTLQQLGGRAAQSKAAEWTASGSGDGSEADASRLAWLTLVLIVFGAAMLFASVSHAAYRLAGSAC